MYGVNCCLCFEDKTFRVKYQIRLMGMVVWRGALAIFSSCLLEVRFGLSAGDGQLIPTGTSYTKKHLSGPELHPVWLDMLFLENGLSFSLTIQRPPSL